MRFRNQDIRQDQKGLAALEFALLAPFLVVLVLGILEVSLRIRAADTFQRYLYQAGDYFSRQDQLFTADIDEMYAAAGDIMSPLEVTGRLDVDVSSVGFIPDGSPELLWRRYRGKTPPTLDMTTFNQLGDPGESVIRVGATFSYQTPITALLGGNAMVLEREVYFRPRLTRVIALDGQVHDAGANWTLDGQSTAGEEAVVSEPGT